MEEIKTGLENKAEELDNSIKDNIFFLNFWMEYTETPEHHKKTTLRIMDKEGEQSQVISRQKQSNIKSWKENLSDKILQ